MKRTNTPVALMNSAVPRIIIILSFPLVDLLHHRKQIFKNLQQAGTCCDDHHGRHDEEEYGEYKLDSDLCGALLCVLLPPGSQIFRMRAKGFSHAGSEPVILHEDSDQLFDLFFS